MQEPITLEAGDDPLDCALGHEIARRSHRDCVVTGSGQSSDDGAAVGAIRTCEGCLARDRDRCRHAS